MPSVLYKCQVTCKEPQSSKEPQSTCQELWANSREQVPRSTGAQTASVGKTSPTRMEAVEVMWHPRQ